MIHLLLYRKDANSIIFFPFLTETQQNNANIMVSTPYPMGAQANQTMSALTYSPVRNQNMRPQQQSFQIQQPQDIKNSAKHTGLYLYLIRLLRPIWKKKCIISPDGTSSLTHENCADILNELYALKAFLEEIPLSNFSEYSTANALNNDYGQSLIQQKSTLEQSIIDNEKRSINALSLFISE